MKPTDFKLTPADAAILSKALQTAKTKSFHRRIQIVYLRSLGKRVHEVSELTNCSTKTVSTLTKLYIEKGVEGLTTETRGGRGAAYRSLEAEKAFLSRFLDFAKEGHELTVKVTYDAYLKEIGRPMTIQGFYTLLRRHGWTRHSPRPEHPNHPDARIIEASKKLSPK